MTDGELEVLKAVLPLLKEAGVRRGKFGDWEIEFSMAVSPYGRETVPVVSDVRRESEDTQNAASGYIPIRLSEHRHGT